MADTHHQHPSKVFLADSMKLASSTSEQNVYLTYVCLVNDVKPGGILSPNFGSNEKGVLEDHPIQVERSKALHELAESYKRAELDENVGEQKAVSSGYPTTTSGEDSDLSENNENIFVPCDKSNVLELTKMKWLTEDPDDAHDSSSPSLSPHTSSSNCSQASENDLKQRNDFEDKYLSTILRLDKEHNMFGLSNIAIVGAKPSKVKRKDEEKAVFHQTAIVQICCARASCCRHKSNTDLPMSLKCGRCGGCGTCCGGQSCSSCYGLCCDGSPSCFFETPSCAAVCSTCHRGKCICKYKTCSPGKCMVDCNRCYGLKIKLNRKPVFEEPEVELTPRSSCILTKPVAARCCSHTPCCIPPSSCFPYLMPCYWPARKSAPCTTPTRCFHNPPCLPARKPRRVPVPPEYICPRESKYEKNVPDCVNDICPGKNPSLKSALKERFGSGSTTKLQKTPSK